MPATRKTATAKTSAKPKPAKAPANVAAEVKALAKVEPKPVANTSGRTPKRIDPAKAAIVGTALGFGLHAAGLM